MPEYFNFTYKRAYQTGVKYNTIVDETYSGGEQRRNLWTNPKRKWVLEFEKDDPDTRAIIDFFEARKGRFEAFYFTWYVNHPITNEYIGGDGSVYLVRFDTDEIELQHTVNGYRKFTLPIMEVTG